MFKNFIDDESGATAIEYGLLATLISVPIIPMMSWFGGNLGWRFSWLGWAIQWGGYSQPTTIKRSRPAITRSPAYFFIQL